MHRFLLDKLLIWKDKGKRKPLLIDGARQTGKTYLLQQLLGTHFNNVLRIDFLESPSMKEAFAGSLSPDEILSSIELITEQVFNPETDLLILDEIGECQRAVNALKFFAEQAPTMYVAASGSNIGLLNTFPVGKVEQYNLPPLTFKEFLLAANEPAVLKAYNNQVNSTAAHAKLFDKLTDYYFTGGMPEAVTTWYELKDNSILERTKAVTKLHQDLILGYLRDFGKYSGKTDAALIESVFTSVPSQLSSVIDESVKRFKFNNVHGRKSRYQQLETSISWLQKCRLISKNYIVDGRPRSPLGAYQKDNMVKLFLMDTGLLNHMLGVSFREIKHQGYEYKGYVAENFVQQELVALGIEPTFSWNDARAEIEFVIQDINGKVIPIEVKSGKRTRARSLESFISKCAPHKSIKLTGTQGSPKNETKHLVYPLYYCEQAIRQHVLDAYPE